MAPLAPSLPRTGRGNEPELLFEKLERGFGDRRPSASSAKDPCSPREKTVANAGNMLRSNLVHSSGVLITRATKTKFSLSPGQTITWRMRDSMLVPEGDSKTDGRARTGPSHYSPLVLTLVLSTAIVVPSLPSLLSGRPLSDEWRARFFDTFEIYRPSERERRGVLLSIKFSTRA